MVYCYGLFWVCVVFDVQWQQQVVLLDFNLQLYLLVMLLWLQQQEMFLVEFGVLLFVVFVCVLLLVGMYGIDDFMQLYEQVLYYWFWYWFVVGVYGVMDGWQLFVLCVVLVLWCDDVDMIDVLVVFVVCSDVVVLVCCCGGDVSWLQCEVCRWMML